MTAVALIAEAASQVSCRILRDGIRTRLFADATLMRYGACTYSGMLDAFSTSASSRGLGFFQLCGLPRKNCTTSAPSAAASARGSSPWTCEPISTSVSLVRRPDTSRRQIDEMARCTRSFSPIRPFGRRSHVPTMATALDELTPALAPPRVRQHHVESRLTARETWRERSVPPEILGICRAVRNVRAAQPTPAHERAPGDTGGFLVSTS